jgi:hypothetical protein
VDEREREWTHNYGQAVLLWTQVLGPKPRRVAAQEVAIRAAADHVIDLYRAGNEVAARLVYQAAVEGWAHGTSPRQPGPEAWQAAVDEARQSLEHDPFAEAFLDRARGGLYLRAKHTWRDAAWLRQARSMATHA